MALLCHGRRSSQSRTLWSGRTGRFIRPALTFHWRTNLDIRAFATEHRLKVTRDGEGEDIEHVILGRIGPGCGCCWSESCVTRVSSLQIVGTCDDES
jgi:hypothetical protein